MPEVTALIPTDALYRFLREHMKCKLLVVAVSGPHAYGYPHSDTPLELKGIHVEPTENIVGLVDPPKAYSWIGEFEGHQIDYSTVELGQASNRLLRGDGSILERIMAPRQLITGEDLRRLQKVTRGVICRRFNNHYRNFARGIIRDGDELERYTVRHILGVYRMALTGVHLLRTGQIKLDLLDLARANRLARIEPLVRTYRDDPEAELEGNDPWVNRIVNLHALLTEAADSSLLPVDPDNPGGLEEYLLDMRRRFFDAPTIQQ